MDTIPGASRFPAHMSRREGIPSRGQRQQSLSSSKKFKAAAIRKIRACFPCQVRRVECTENRPCLNCQNTKSKRAINLRWMGCVTISVAVHSIYGANSHILQNCTPQTLDTLHRTIDEIQLPRGSVVTFSLDFLATDVANWITHAESGISTSKLSLLCASQFQEIAGQSLGDAFIRDFRLLVWTTTLAHSAMNSGSLSEADPTRSLALSNLRILVHLYGERVIPHLENLCRPQSLRKLSIEQHKLLFLIVIGMCLSATYTPMANEMNSQASYAAGSTSSYSHADTRLHTFVEGLAYLGTYIGHICHLFTSRVDSRALVAAAQRRWDRHGGYTWQVPHKLSRNLTAELSGETNLDAATGPSQDNMEAGTLMNQFTRNNSPEGMPELPEDLEDTITCADCLETGFPCCICEFTTNNDPSEIEFTPDVDPTEQIYTASVSANKKGSHRGANMSSKIDIQRSSGSYTGTFRYVPTIVGYSRSDLWFCCECGDGPKLIAIQPACCLCEHKGCSSCSYQFS